MTLANAPRRRLLALLAALGWSLAWLLPGLSYGSFFSFKERHYGPTTPGGYTVRVTPQSATMAYSQRQAIEVRVEDGSEQSVNGVAVHFQPSEGTVTTDVSETRDGVVTGTFAAATGNHQPHTAFIVVSVEDIDVTVFIDIVPMVYGH